MDGWLFGLMAIDIGPINYYIHDYKSEVSRKGRGGGVPANFFTIEKRIPTNLCSMREREMKKKTVQTLSCLQVQCLPIGCCVCPFDSIL